jgi:hypothetical protein
VLTRPRPWWAKASRGAGAGGCADGAKAKSTGGEMRLHGGAWVRSVAWTGLHLVCQFGLRVFPVQNAPRCLIYIQYIHSTFIFYNQGM